ncbi:hypothetical protein HanXRQr2_Chr09g0374821 [Helianthus annuus]|uniref:Uncharacterized protein n=1 Tax=Helianthus annuus TaxID=4232 RepID=A0A9K3I3F0_HELAN|nr:hypothetical protein HanXRQr2_Chr09g0374821 [Helianthus annuus]
MMLKNTKIACYKPISHVDIESRTLLQDEVQGSEETHNKSTANAFPAENQYRLFWKEKTSRFHLVT